ncbi:MAG: rhodanese-like domain-containing protein [Sulfurovum sp.]
MFYRVVLFLFVGSLAIARVGFEYDGIIMSVTDAKGVKKDIEVKRYIPKECLKIPINNDMVWTGNYANPKVPKKCTSTFVHTTGKLLPISLDEDIETYGELEVLAFMKEISKGDKKKVLIDGRTESWYEYRTIAGAVNMSFKHFKDRERFHFEFKAHLKDLGVVINKNETLNFDKAKEVVIFCNGPWCGQSVAMIRALEEIGYPLENIKWYRGGLQNWLGAGMTSTRD